MSKPITDTLPPHTVSTERIALVGNPNAGKSSLFNLLTGLNQKVGNYPGVTVDKKVGTLHLPSGRSLQVVDLPGTYSIFPRSSDELVVADQLLNLKEESFQAIVVVVDATNLERNLLLCTQLIDLGLPIVLVLNMADLVQKRKISLNTEVLRRELGNIPIVQMNARRGEGLNTLKNKLDEVIDAPLGQFYDPHSAAAEAVSEVKYQLGCQNYYQAYLLLHYGDSLTFLSPAEKKLLQNCKDQFNFNAEALQVEETTQRYQQIDQIVAAAISTPEIGSSAFTEKLDQYVTHKVFGYLIFFGLLLLIFQAIFAWAAAPMDFIDLMFGKLGTWISETLPEGPLTDLLAEGIVPGIGGIVIFIPQIAILFAFITVLEESGYMARVVFMMDKLMRKVGLNGRSVVPLISGLACAIPAIMATRGIDDWKDRLITIFVTPFMSCSARLPVYVILIGLVVPEKTYLGVFNLAGLVLMGLYLLGFFMAISSAWVMKKLIRAKSQGFLIMELPAYRWPRWGNVGVTVLEKSRAFVFEAGKIILAVSIILWVLASYGPGDAMQQAEEQIIQLAQQDEALAESLDTRIESARLQESYAGQFGKWIEPVIRPLGYDWKIGIALITSFAAREVFVGTIATLYSIGDTDSESTIKSRLRNEINPETGGPRYTPAVAFSLLVFYAFAMQCMSTLAIVKQETRSWRWPLLQLLYMTIAAYVAALLVYQLMS
ncbi:ferrous iron transport protein B [Tunicatimonas pelagia]|uniref:ferrous iron transport protein B n=1 Tax=Tunicatimonas pelagia TaxID=931531 RepID=UPI0026667B3B|nr:ferrous iron transport protein B [Tunicatimonas pelagia]WKN42500.1 ferrous iron transport protein B [Tunicatimonas pelagia]